MINLKKNENLNLKLNRKYTAGRLIFLIALHVIVFYIVVIILFFLLIFLLILINLFLNYIFEILFLIWQNLFYILIPLILFISSLIVILIQNPIYALFALIIVFVTAALFLLAIKIQFLAFVYLIVYIGAIAILFLFVIMLFNLKLLNKNSKKNSDFTFLTISLKFYIFFGLKVFILIAFEIWYYIDYSSYINTFISYKDFDLYYYLNVLDKDLMVFGNLFYTYYIYFFILSGIILLFAMIGSIILVLSIKTMSNKKKRKIYDFYYIDLHDEAEDIKAIFWASVISVFLIMFYWYFKIFFKIRLRYRKKDNSYNEHVGYWGYRFNLSESLTLDKKYLQKRFRLITTVFNPKKKRARVPTKVEYEYSIMHRVFFRYCAQYMFTSERDIWVKPEYNLTMFGAPDTILDITENIEKPVLRMLINPEQEQVLFEEYQPQDFTYKDYLQYYDKKTDYRDIAWVIKYTEEHGIHDLGDDLDDFLALYSYDTLLEFIKFKQMFKFKSNLPFQNNSYNYVQKQWPQNF